MVNKESRYAQSEGQREGEEWRTTARDGGVVTGGGDGSEMGIETEGKKKLMPSIDVSLTPDFRVKRKATT